MTDLTVVDGEAGQDQAEGHTFVHDQHPSVPNIVQLMAKASELVPAIGKDGRMSAGQGGNYSYRKIDDVIDALHGILAGLGIVTVPRLLHADYEWRSRGGDRWGRHTILTVAFRFYGPRMDYLETITNGEAADTGDKGSNKAHTAAMKVALCQAFLIPFDSGDPDDTPNEDTGPAEQAPARRQSRSRTKKDDAPDGAPTCGICGETLAGRGAVKKGPDGAKCHADCLVKPAEETPAATPAEPDLSPTDAEVECGICHHTDHPGEPCQTADCPCTEEPF